MATTERPPIKIGGKRNPEYDRWYREQKKAATPANEHPPELPASDPAPAADGDSGGDPVAVEVIEPPQIHSLDPQDPAYVKAFNEAVEFADELMGEAQIFQSAAEPEQTTIDDPREPEVAPALEPLKDGDTLEITVDRCARNKVFVYGALNGELVPIRVKKKTGPKLVGKPINVTVTVEAGHTLFTHTP